MDPEGYHSLTSPSAKVNPAFSDIKYMSSTKIGSAADDDDIPDATIDREVALELVRRRAYRVKQCRSVPTSVCCFVLFIVAILTHVSIPTGYDVEKNLVDNIVNAGDGFYPASTEDFYAYVTDTFLPATLGSDGYIGNYNLMIGGIRLATTRSTPSQCSMITAPLASLYGQECYPESSSLSSYSSATYGNATIAEDGGVASAFVAVPSADSSGIPEFEWFIDTLSDTDSAGASIAALSDAGWLDQATRTAKVQVAILNGEVGSFARIEIAATFTRGSRVATSYEVTSVPSNPYTPASNNYLYLIDVVMIFYWVYLLVGTVRRLVAALRAPGSLCDRVVSLFSYWRLLDVSVVCSLLAVIITWATLCSKLASIRNNIASIADVSPESFTTGPTELQYQIFDASSSLRSFKIAGVITVILLTLRLLKYLAFQPRLAFCSEIFRRGFSDIVHHGFVYVALLTMWGIWGHFLFGTQAPDWASLPRTITTIFRFSQYDYDLEAMEAQYMFLADLFYASFMILVTNFLVWMLMGILLENYTEIRYESHRGPSAWEEFRAYLQTVPQQFPCTRCIMERCCSGGKRHRLRRRLGYTMAEVSSRANWADVAKGIETDPELRRARVVTAQPLARVLGVTIDEANLLIAELAASVEIMRSLPAPYGLESLASGLAPRDPGASASSADTRTENLARALYGAWSEGALPPVPATPLMGGAATAGPLSMRATSSSSSSYGTAAAGGGGVAAAAGAVGEGESLLGGPGGIVGIFGRGTLRQASMRLADTTAALQQAQAALAASADGATAVSELTSSVNELRAQVAAVLAAVQARGAAAAPGTH